MDQPRERHRIQCLECAKWYRIIGPHLRTHGMSEEDYRLKFGLPAGLPLACEEWCETVSRKMIVNEIAKKNLTARGPKPGFKQRESTRANRQADYERIGAMGRKIAHAMDKTAAKRVLLKPYPVTVPEAAERLQCSPVVANAFLRRCVVTGRLRRVSRGVYDEITPEADASQRGIIPGFRESPSTERLNIDTLP